MSAVKWKNDPQDHDYPAAAAYLSLLLSDSQVAGVISALEKSTVVTQKAKDILRAAQLPLLPKNDEHVAGDLDKISKGEALSPVLLLRGRLDAGVPLQIADGYHRVCAVYYTDEDTDIPCRIGDLSK